MGYEKGEKCFNDKGSSKNELSILDMIEQIRGKKRQFKITAAFSPQ